VTHDDASRSAKLTWDGFGEATRDLSRAIVRTGSRRRRRRDRARRSAPAGAIAYGLGVKSCGALNVEFYTGIGTVLEAPALLPPDLDLGYLPGKRVLLVDDVADSGRTLALAVTMLEDAGADVRSVCIYTAGSVASPDYSWRETDRWIDFPGRRAARSPRRMPGRRRTRRQRLMKTRRAAEAGLIDAGGPRRSHPSPRHRRARRAAARRDRRGAAVPTGG
jgi:hypothetical protein